MIDPATGWSEMAQIPNKTAAEIADITKFSWLYLPDSAYPILYHDISKAQETDAKLQQN